MSSKKNTKKPGKVSIPVFYLPLIVLNPYPSAKSLSASV